jgi:hypothetical protein
MNRLKDAIIRTSKWPIQRRVRIIEDINQRFQRRVQSSNHQKDRHAENRIVDDGQRQLPSSAVLLVPVEVQPECRCQSKSEPADEDGCTDVQDRAEDRNGV